MAKSPLIQASVLTDTQFIGSIVIVGFLATFLLANVVKFGRQVFSGNFKGLGANFRNAFLKDAKTLELKKIFKEFEPAISAILRTIKNPNITVDIIISIIFTESGGNPKVTGNAGEKGLMQITFPALFDVNNAFGTTFNFEADLFNPGTNIIVGTRFLVIMFRKMGNIFDALRAYNAGAGAATENKNISRSYAVSVLKTAKLIQDKIMFK